MSKFCLEWNLDANLRAVAMSLIYVNFSDIARYEKYVSIKQNDTEEVSYNSGATGSALLIGVN